MKPTPENQPMQVMRQKRLARSTPQPQQLRPVLSKEAQDLASILSELVAMDNCNYDRAIQQTTWDKARALLKTLEGLTP